MARRACTPTPSAFCAPQVGITTRRDFPPTATAAAAAAGTEIPPKDSHQTRSASIALEGATHRAKAIRGRCAQHSAPSAGSRTSTVRSALMTATRAPSASSRSKAPPHAQTAQAMKSLPRTAGCASARSPHSAQLVKKLSIRAPQAARTAPRGGMRPARARATRVWTAGWGTMPPHQGKPNARRARSIL